MVSSPTLPNCCPATPSCGASWSRSSSVVVVVVPSSFWNSKTMSIGGGGGTAPSAASGGSMLNTIPSVPFTATTNGEGASNIVGAPSWTVMSDMLMPGPNLITLVTGVLIQSLKAVNAASTLAQSILPGSRTASPSEPCRAYRTLLIS